MSCPDHSFIAALLRTSIERTPDRRFVFVTSPSVLGNGASGTSSAGSFSLLSEHEIFMLFIMHKSFKLRKMGRHKGQLVSCVFQRIAAKTVYIDLNQGLESSTIAANCVM